MGTFTFQLKNYTYLEHSYNDATNNERAVEIPIIWDIITRFRRKKILEVGNVLSHYFPIEHDIVDKYEKAPNVINEDIVDYNPKKKYNLIVSISTLEHVGWDEEPREPQRIIQAVANLKKFLVPNGILVATLPLGYNHEMDKMLGNKELVFSKQYYLKRISNDNKWKEVDWDEIKGIKYNEPFPFANGLVIGKITAPGRITKLLGLSQ